MKVDTEGEWLDYKLPKFYTQINHDIVMGFIYSLYVCFLL